MGLFIAILFTAVLSFFFGFLVEASSLVNPHLSDKLGFSLWPLFLTSIVSGAAGGFVHALENDKTHEIKVPFKGHSADSGVFGHIFIGICGAIVAVAVMTSIMGMDINPMVSPADGASMLKGLLHVAAISIIGGYSGLPIIALISNAALKKVQKQVEALEDSDLRKNERIQRFEGEVESLQAKLQEKDRELQEVSLKSVLLSAESKLKNGYYADAIKTLRENYLPSKQDNYMAYLWLALSEKRVGNLPEALLSIQESLKLKKSRIGYYNLACYQCLLGESPRSIFDNIELAWKHCDGEEDRKRLIKGLKDDEDLSSLRENNKFKNDYAGIIKKYEAHTNLLGDNDEKDS